VLFRTTSPKKSLKCRTENDARQGEEHVEPPCLDTIGGRRRRGCIAALQASPCFAEDTGITHLPRTQLLYYQYS